VRSALGRSGGGSALRAVALLSALVLDGQGDADGMPVALVELRPYAGAGGGPRDALSSRGGGCLVDEGTFVADGGRW